MRSVRQGLQQPVRPRHTHGIRPRTCGEARLHLPLHLLPSDLSFAPGTAGTCEAAQQGQKGSAAAVRGLRQDLPEPQVLPSPHGVASAAEKIFRV